MNREWWIVNREIKNIPQNKNIQHAANGYEYFYSLFTICYSLILNFCNGNFDFIVIYFVYTGTWNM